MSEYWKSTPKYWCKFCKVFVKDTKLGRSEHDATPRHQGNIQRSLRGLHREKEQEDRQKQRAKDEVARLNGLTSGTSAGGSSAAPPGAVSVPAAKPTAPPKSASLEDRKKQMKQLSDMGVAIPEEFRREMGLAGDWQTIKVTPVANPLDEELGPDTIAFGVRKRKFEDQAEEEAIKGAEEVHRQSKNWGSKFKSWSEKGGAEDDLDALIGGIKMKRDIAEDGGVVKAEPKDPEPIMKRAESDEEQEVTEKLKTLPSDAPIKSETVPEHAAESPATGIVFKKRKRIGK